MSNYVVKIITDVDKLSERVDETIVTPQNEAAILKAVNEAKETLRAHENSYAITASQIGYNYRFFCIKFAGGDIRAFINPLIVTSKGLHLSREKYVGRDDEFIIPRHDTVTIAYQTPTGKNEVNTFEGLASEVTEQMIQLLDGVLLDDLGLPVLEGFDELDEKTKQQIIDSYIDYLQSYNEDMKEEIQNNPNLKKLDDAAKFLESVTLGETKAMLKISEKPEENDRN